MTDRSGKRAHDLRNAVHVVNGAVYALDALASDLAEHEREQLKATLESGLSRLGSMLTAGVDTSVLLDAAVADAVDEVRATGLEIQARTDVSVVINGDRPEIVSILSDLFRSTCASGACTVSVGRDGAEGIVSIEPNLIGKPGRVLAIRFPLADGSSA